MYRTFAKRYLQLTKPTMVMGNLVAAAGGYFLAARGDVDALRLLLTLGGIGMVVSAACVFNNFIDRHIDRQMARTRDRALASGQIEPKAAFFYAFILGLGGTAVLWTTANALCVAIVLAGFAVYVVVYSLLLKRVSVYSTLVGSLAGAAPPLAGYCAASQHFDVGAAILLAIFCLWQIPHTYAIAVFRRQDYTNAAIPLLPVKHGTAAAKKHIIGHILAFALTAPMLTMFGYTGNAYLAAALLVGLAWLALALAGYKSSDDPRWARRLFVFSLVGITVLSVMMAADTALPPALSACLLQTP
jgi:protoheme IX farnesyltransferase